MTIALRISTSILLLLALTVGDSAGVQARRIDTRAAAEALARLRPETPIRIETKDGRRITGRLDSVSFNAVGLSHDGAVESINLDGLAAVWTRGRRTKAGAIVGGVLGFGLGFLGSAAAKSGCETDDCAADSYVPRITILGLSIGALVGGAVGATIPNWRRMLP